MILRTSKAENSSMDKDNQIIKNVSRETIDQLKIYQGLLENWQKKINLISSKTLPHVWRRHFEDSLQLLPWLPKQKFTLLDLGSGAGFPGLVLAISCKGTAQTTLIESDLKKTVFLENVSRETKTPTLILKSRIEEEQNIKADVITARALSSLESLLDYAYPFMKKNSYCLFLKGKGVDSEIKVAQKKWEFDLEILESMTDATGRILKIKNLQRNSVDDKNYSCCESKGGSRENHNND